MTADHFALVPPESPVLNGGDWLEMGTMESDDREPQPSEAEAMTTKTTRVPDRYPPARWPTRAPMLACGDCGRLTDTVDDQARHVLHTHRRTRLTAPERTPPRPRPAHGTRGPVVPNAEPTRRRCPLAPDPEEGR